MASVALFFSVFLVLSGEVSALLQRDSDEGELVMDKEELLGLYEVMSSLLEDPSWPEVHPEPCTDTPWPGVGCESGDEDPPIFHVTKIHIGPDVVIPPCKTSANLSDSLLKLPYLKTVSIFKCFVSSPVTLSPSLFGAFLSLEHLALESNPTLSGDIPPSLAEIASLRVLSLSQNTLRGKIPKELGGLVNLEQLDLSYNNLSGDVPEEIGGLKSLTIMDLSWNGLEGQLPCSLGMLQLLQKIDLSSNRLLGSIPAALGNLNRLVLLDLSHNFINGQIPETLSGLDQLQYLILDHNPIDSVIPLFVGTLKNLTSISFSGCGLTGPVPEFLSSLKNLAALSLNNNSLSGTIPLSLGSLPNLDLLNLSHNQLSGDVLLPEEFIDRLGKRLDVRGNNGLCTPNMKRNVSLYLEIPPCLGTKGIGENKSFPGKPDDSIEKEPSSYHGKISSKAQWVDRKLLYSAFVVCLSQFLVVMV